MVRFPRFDYPITRDVQWRMEPLAYSVALLAVAILIPMNYVLTGYETVPATSQDYNYVPNHWYYRFSGRPKPGSYCDPYKFTIGDSFVTNTSILTYQLVAVLGNGGGSSAVSSIDYRGSTLQTCDVSSMGLITDVRANTASITADVACTNETGFPVVLTASYDYSFYGDPWQSTYSKQQNYHIGNLTPFNYFGFNVSRLLSYSLMDFVANADAMYSTGGSPSVIASTAYTVDYPSWWRPISNLTTNPTCRTAIPDIPLRPVALQTAEGEVQAQPNVLVNYTSISNAMQIMLAAVRIDLGNILPTNMIANRSLELINAAIAPTFSFTSVNDTPMLYGSLAAPEQIVYIPVNVEDAEKYPSIIPVNYLCRLEQQKSAGSIFVAVSVATLTLFKSGWAVFLLILAFLAKREQPEVCKSCAGHEELAARMREVEHRLSLGDITPSIRKLEKEV